MDKFKNKFTRRKFLRYGAASLAGIASSGFLVRAGQAEEPIKILGTVAFSGAASNIGPGYDKAIRLAVNEINRLGIEGFSRMDYKVVDTETKPSVVKRKLRREVLTWDPDLVGGVALETTIRPLLQELPQYKTVGFVGGHLSMTKYIPPGEVPYHKWLAYYGYADYFAGQLAGRFFEKMGAEKVALVGGDYDWGYSNSIGLKAHWLKEKPFEISPVIYTPLDKTDYSTEVQIIKKEKPDALFCPYTGAGWMSLPKQLREAGARPEIFLYGTTYSNMGGAKVTGAYGAENIYTLADHDPGTKEWAEYVKKWKDAYGAKAYPDTYSNNYYQQIYWFKKVFEKAGTKDSEMIVETMQNTAFQNICISPMGPMGPYGSNMGAKGAIIQFATGSSDLDPTFDLHPELRETYVTPEMTIPEILDEMQEIERLKPEKSYPKGGS